MTINQLPSYTDYAATMPAPVIFVVVSLIAGFAAVTTLLATVGKLPAAVATILCVVGVIAVIAAMISVNAVEDGLARLRAEVVSQHLDETYGVDVDFGEDGVRPDTLDGNTVHNGGSVYTINVTTDGSILLVDEGGKEVPRISR